MKVTTVIRIFEILETHTDIGYYDLSSFEVIKHTRLNKKFHLELYIPFPFPTFNINHSLKSLVENKFKY